MGANAKLTVEAGFGRGREYELEEGKPFYVGRDRKCDYYIPSGQASRVHCKIEGSSGSFGVFDLESRNGTLVNEERVDSRVLRPGDAVTVAGNRLRFEMGDVVPSQLTRMGGKLEGKPVKQAEAEPPIVAAPRPKAKPKSSETGDFESEIGFFNYSDVERERVGKALGEVKLLGLLGKGQHCVVYKASDATKNRLVSVKFLRSDLAEDAEVKRWLVQGAKRAGELRHENGVRIIGGGRDGENLYVVLQQMEQNAFERFSEARDVGLPAVKSALQTLVNITRALEFGVREGGELYGGVRPSKIFYDERRQAKLSGLGFDNKLSSPGAQLGPRILAYNAPELERKPEEATVGTDIYSLGATFYYMLTSESPTRDNRSRMASPKEINAAVPDSLVRIYEKMVAAAPEGRYESYSHLLHDLRWALRGEVWHHT